jgi:pseudomonalisin/xanthomonalisin
MDHVQAQWPLASTQSIPIVVTLSHRNREQLDARAAAIISPDSPDYQHWMSHDELERDYIPTTEQVTRVIKYLEGNGFSEIQVIGNRALIHAVGTPASIHRAFKTELVGALDEVGHVGHVNVDDAQVPQSLAQDIDGVVGLQSLHAPFTNTATRPILNPPIQPGDLPIAYDTSAGNSAKCVRTVSQTLGDASSDSVGIIGVGNMAGVVSDVVAYETFYGLGQNIPSVKYATSVPPLAIRGDEWATDVETIVGQTCGRVNSMTIYAGSALTDADLLAAMAAAIGDKSAQAPAVISMSIGQCEVYAHSDGFMSAGDAILASFAAGGGTFVVSSGNYGGDGCILGSKWVQYPASSPYVIAVGGEELIEYSNPRLPPRFTSADAWSNSGGGLSAFESRPAWQYGAQMGSSPFRGVPDLAMGVTLYALINGRPYQLVTGTSVAAPAFAASYARIRTSRRQVHHFPGFPAAALYRLQQQAETSPGSTPLFLDITTGSNTLYTATPSWDFMTGLGHPILSNINDAL